MESNSLFECTSLLKIHTLAQDPKQVGFDKQRRASLRLSSPSLTLEEFEFVNVDKSVIVECSTYSSIKMFSFVVLYLNNNYFIFQYRETVAHSIVCKYLEWLPGEGKRVVSVDIDASESNVLVTCLDGFTTIIPIYCITKQQSLSSLGENIKSLTSSASNSRNKSTSSAQTKGSGGSGGGLFAKFAKIGELSSFPLGNNNNNTNNNTNNTNNNNKFGSNSNTMDRSMSTGRSASVSVSPLTHLHLPVPSTTVVSKCIWWNLKHLLFSTLDGFVKLVSLASGAEVYSYKLKAPVVDMHIINSGAVQCALITLHNKSQYMLFLSNARGTLLTFGNVTPTLIQRNGVVTAQSHMPTGQALLAIERATGTLQLYTLRTLTSPTGYPLYDYALAPFAPLRHLLVTPRLLFVVSAAAHDELCVLSRVLMAQHGAKAAAVLARFRFASPIHALYRAHDTQQDDDDNGHDNDDDVDADAILRQLQTHDAPSNIDTTSHATTTSVAYDDDAARDYDSTDETALPSSRTAAVNSTASTPTMQSDFTQSTAHNIVVVLSNATSIVKLTQSPAGVVLRMLGKGDEASAARAEQLGVAFGLDIVKLQGDGARLRIQRGQIDAAVRLFIQAGTDACAAANDLIDAGHTVAALQVLMAARERRDSLTIVERQKISAVIVKLHINALIQHDSINTPIDNDSVQLRYFCDDPDCNVLELLNALCDANLISSLIRVGHARGCMAQVLQLLVERRSNTRLSSSDVAYLADNHYLTLLLLHHESLLDGVDCEERVRLWLREDAPIVRGERQRHVLALAPTLSPVALARSAMLLSGRAEPDCVELRLVLLLRLGWMLTREREHAPRQAALESLARLLTNDRPPPVSQRSRSQRAAVWQTVTTVRAMPAPDVACDNSTAAPPAVQPSPRSHNTGGAWSGALAPLRWRLQANSVTQAHVWDACQLIVEAHVAATLDKCRHAFALRAALDYENFRVATLLSLQLNEPVQALRWALEHIDQTLARFANDSDDSNQVNADTIRDWFAALDRIVSVCQCDTVQRAQLLNLILLRCVQRGLRHATIDDCVRARLPGIAMPMALLRDTSICVSSQCLGDVLRHLPVHEQAAQQLSDNICSQRQPFVVALQNDTARAYSCRHETRASSDTATSSNNATTTRALQQTHPLAAPLLSLARLHSPIDLACPTCVLRAIGAQ